MMSEEEQRQSNSAETEAVAYVHQFNEIHGDILETIFSHVPLLHLLSATFVSKSWNAAVYSSLRLLNKPKPWLLAHTQSIRSPHATAAFAYDPRSDVWLQINQKLPQTHVSPLRSSNSALLYALSPSKFSFSVDPLHLAWHHVDPPAVWRTDPVVAVVGHRVIVAGGACEYEDDPLAVEIYDINTRTWETSESMPATLKDSAAFTWLSVATDAKTMYVMEQTSGITHLFDPSSKVWSRPYDLRPDQSIYFSTIGFYGDGLIMVGLLGDPENLKGVKMWEVKGESLEFREEIGVMPKELVDKLKGEATSFHSIKLSSMADCFYIYNPGQPAELVAFEVGGGGLICRWRSLKNVAVSERSIVSERMALTCSDVCLGDLARALGSGDGSFTLIQC